MSSRGSILLTGATGFLGYKVLTLALKAGYDVQVAVRSAAKLQKILNAPTIKSLKPTEKQLSHITVPDMTAPGAYDEATKGVDYVIHCASPIPSFGDAEAPTAEEYEEYFVKTARTTTISLLESIQRSGTVKRVVVTSSTVANIPFEYLIGQGDDRTFTAEDRIPVAAGPYGFEFQAYSAGKAAALNESEKFVAERKPGFDLISILPGWIFGRDELVTEAADFGSGSTNSVLLGLLRGSQSDAPFNGNSVLLDDAAQLHVSALDSSIKGNQAFFATSDGLPGMVWEESIKITKENYPEAIKAGHLAATGKQPTIVINMDSKKTEEVFGFKFATFEEQVKSLVGQYLELK